MRQTLRQIVAVLALAGIALSLVPNALAASYAGQASADKLAAEGYIVDKSATPAEYRLGDTLKRSEATKVVAKGRGVLIEPVVTTGCKSRFTDVLPGTWECAVIEIAAETGLTKVDAGQAFRPSATLSKYEAMAFAFRSSCTEVPTGTDTTEMGALAVEAGIITNAAAWNATGAATRGDFFNYVAAAMDETSCEPIEDEEALCTMFPALCEDPTDPTDPETPSTGDVEVSLSDETPAGRTLPKGANGVVVASYDITAGSDDALVSGVKLSREGLSVDADVENFAILVDGVRVTDAKDENSDDEVTLTFKNGGVAVDAGETVTIEVVIDTTSAAVTGAEIAVALVEVTTGGDVDGLPVVGETFKIGSVNAPKLEVLVDGSVTDPQLGETGADLFRFKVKNTSDSNDTVSLEAITFEQTGGIDETSELANYKLLKGSEVLATVESTDSKYVTFVLDTPLAITQGNNVALKVVADVVGGAGEDIIFGVDQKLDVVASTTRYGNGVAVTIPAAFASVSVEAGTIALAKMDAAITKVREDKDDIVLGTLKITAAQTGLEMKKIGVSITTTNAGANTAGTDANVDGDCLDVGDTAATATGPYTLSVDSCTSTDVVSGLLEDVQLRDTKTGARYDLTAGAGTSTQEFYDSSIDFTLSQGVTTFEVLADTDATISGFDKVNFVLSINSGDKVVGGASTNGGLLIQETGDDTDVDDITPSSLTWKKVEGSESGATFSVLPMADITKVRGANDVIAMQFEIEADESGSVNLDEIKAAVTIPDSADVGADRDPATNQMVSQVALYKGSTVNEANLLDTVSGSNLAAGVATFDGFDVVVNADAKQTFTVTLSFVDGVDASALASNPYRVSIAAAASISATDDENDDITVGGTFPGVSPRDITVTDKGTVTLSQDANNVDNKDPKTILAGTSAKVFSADIQAQNEPVDVDRVVFTLDKDVTGSVKNASLYLGDTLIATNTSTDITATEIIFKNLSTLVLPQEQKELVLAFNTDTIGFEKNGSTETGVNVINVALEDMTGSNSGIDLADQLVNAITTSSKDVAIVPAKVTASVASALTSSSSQAKLTISVEKGDNTVDLSNTAPTALLTNLIFTELGNADEALAGAEYKIYKEGNAGLFGTINCSAGACTFAAGTMTAAELTVTTSATFVIVPTGTVDKTYSPVLGKSGVVYTVAGVAGSAGLTSNAPSDLELGSRTY